MECLGVEILRVNGVDKIFEILCMLLCKIIVRNVFCKELYLWENIFKKFFEFFIDFLVGRILLRIINNFYSVYICFWKFRVL